MNLFFKEISLVCFLFCILTDRMASQAEIIDVFDGIDYDYDAGDVATSGDEYVLHLFI